MRNADAHAEVELPGGTEVDVHRWKELLLLLADRIEGAHRAIIAVIFKTARDSLCDLITELHRWSEGRALGGRRAVPGTLQCRIEGEVPRPDLLVDDRPDFPGPGVFRK